MLTLTQIASLKRDAYKPNYGSKAYSPSVVIDLIETLEQFIGEILIDRPRPRDPFDLRHQVPADTDTGQLELFGINGNFLIIEESRGRAAGEPGEPLFYGRCS